MGKKKYELLSAPEEEKDAAEVAATEAEKKEERKQSRLAKASFAWTVISVLYALVSGAVLISENWILSPYSYVMAGLLAVYVVFFAVIIFIYAGDVKGGKKKIKTFKKLFGMFRIFTTLVFLVATAMSMVGVVDAKGTGLWQWVVLGANILVAAVQLSLKLSLFIINLTVKKLGQKYTVRVQTYVNGVGKDNKAKSKVMSKIYGTEVTPDAAADTCAETAQPKQEASSEKAVKVKLEKEQVRAMAAKAAEKLSVKKGGKTEE